MDVPSQKTFQVDLAMVTLENDNMLALDMIKALRGAKRSKFVDMRHHFLKQVIEEK